MFNIKLNASVSKSSIHGGKATNSPAAPEAASSLQRQANDINQKKFKWFPSTDYDRQITLIKGIFRFYISTKYKNLLTNARQQLFLQTWSENLGVCGSALHVGGGRHSCMMCLNIFDVFRAFETFIPHFLQTKIKKMCKCKSINRGNLTMVLIFWHGHSFEALSLFWTKCCLL